jgi:AcrR family transcriptional regulator
MTTAPTPSQSAHGEATADARERILRTAYDLFCQYGVKAIGVDRIISEANVAKMTLYRHFRSKDELVLAVLERREQLWTWGWLEREIEQRGETARSRLLACFDVFDEWFRREDFESCLFITCLYEAHDVASPIGAASATGLANIRSLLRRLAEEVGVRDPDSFARQWQIVMSGAITAATGGDKEAALRAREVGELMLAREELAVGVQGD